MKLKFLGADHEVTGSCHYLMANGKNILIDCGMEQGNDVYENQELPIPASEVDYVLLTHAHIDHSGLIPLLYSNGFRGQVYTTRPTVDLCDIMLKDSAHIQMFEAEWRNRKAKRSNSALKEFIPLYTMEDAINVMEQFVGCPYDEKIDLCDGVQIRFIDAGHLLGSASIEVWVTESTDDGDITKKIVFSGDIGNINKPIIKDPQYIKDADYVIMESTYGNRYHEECADHVEELTKIFKRTFDRGGNVVIPSFAVGRTQEILYELNKIKETKNDEEFMRKYETLMKVPVYVDSPLAISATEVFKENMDLFDEETQEEMKKGDHPLEFPGLKFTVTADESKALNENPEPCIIISASGMCEVGRIKHHLKHNLWNPNSTILFVGYQAPGTLGYSIVNGAKKVKIFGEEIAVNARIEYLEGYSGHADQDGLMNFIYSFRKKPKQIFLVHGEEESQEVLEQKIQEEIGLPVTIPDYGETYEINAEEDVKLTHKMNRKLPVNTRIEALNRLEKLKDELLDMETAVKEDMNNKELRDEDIYRINEKIKDLEKQILNVIEG